VKFPIDNFWKFCQALQVETKEHGLIPLGRQLLGTQKYLIQEMVKGLEDDIHYFVVLKGRQQGISTISLALDLYWHMRYPGTQGTLVTDNESNRDMFKSTFDMYLTGLPKAFKVRSTGHNKNQLLFANRSRISYQVAGSRGSGSLGRGKAIMFMHATELSSWGNQEGLASLEASLALHNEKRLYIFESTARGYNMFHDMWETASNASSQKAIFVGWWLDEMKRFNKDSREYQTYWDGKLSTEEKVWTKEVKEKYGVEVSSEQIAWWRWAMQELIKDEILTYQEFPPTEDYAFVLSGSQFFNTGKINDEYKRAKNTTCDNYRFIFGSVFKDSELIPTSAKNSTLKIWEYPQSGAHYVIGADPAYGSSEWADRFAIQVFRCYADKLEQVAEFCTSECRTDQFAWALCYLGGYYGPNVLVNLEINGPGQSVFAEMQNLKRTAAIESNVSGNREMANILGNIQSYLYKRVDSPGSGIGAYHWKTTYDSKLRMMNQTKDAFERGILLANSTELLEEMKGIRMEDGFIGAPGRGKDDRVIATALGVIAWADKIQTKLLLMNNTYEREQAAKELRGSVRSIDNTVQNYLKNIGYVKNEQG